MQTWGQVIEQEVYAGVNLGIAARAKSFQTGSAGTWSSRHEHTRRDRIHPGIAAGNGVHDLGLIYRGHRVIHAFLTGLIAAYLCWIFWNRFDLHKALYNAYYLMGFTVLLISGLLLIFLGLDTLSSPWVLTIASLIPLGISMGLAEEYFPAWKKAYKWFAAVGFLAIAITVVALHLIALNVLYPKFLGNRLQLNPLAVTMALLFWAWLWGAAGLVLAIPITAAMKIIFDHIESLKPWGAWLGE